MATARNASRRSGSADLQSSIASRILAMVGRKKECNIDDLLQSCDSYTWNQVFLEVDRLSRTGELRLQYRKDGDYAVSLPRAV